MSEVEVIAEVGSIEVCGFLSSSDSLAMLAAIRRASSRVNSFAAARLPGSSSK
jgi:hypothetical protein